MSYTTFKRIKQNKDNTFTVTASDSSIRDYNGKKIWNSYTIDYYKDKGMTKNQVLTSFLSVYAYGGGRFYSPRYKELCKKVLTYIGDHDIKVSEFENKEYLNNVSNYLGLK